MGGPPRRQGSGRRSRDREIPRGVRSYARPGMAHFSRRPRPVEDHDPESPLSPGLQVQGPPTRKESEASFLQGRVVRHDTFRSSIFTDWTLFEGRLTRVGVVPP